MKITKRRGYNNYGMYPTNEYTTPNERVDANPDVDLNEAPQAHIAEPKQPMLRRLHYLLSPRKSGWLRTQSTSGWRAKAAADQHEDYHT